MSFHRVTLVALATLFTIGLTSIASACCGGGYSAAVVYAPAAPVAYSGCGACGGPTAAAVYAQPVAPAPIYVTSAPVISSFGGPCCGGGACGNCGGWVASTGCGCGSSVGYAAPQQLYVVNQGPDYTGPGLTVPYSTYSPETAYAPATDYPYVPGSGYGASIYYGHPYYHARYGYRGAAYMHPHYAYRRPVYMQPHFYRSGQRFYGAPHWRHYR